MILVCIFGDYLKVYIKCKCFLDGFRKYRYKTCQEIIMSRLHYRSVKIIFRTYSRSSSRISLNILLNYISQPEYLFYLLVSRPLGRKIRRLRLDDESCLVEILKSYLDLSCIYNAYRRCFRKLFRLAVYKCSLTSVNRQKSVIYEYPQRFS